MSVPRRRLHLSGYRSMWLFAMFDLPVDTKKARREYTRFRKALLAQGFRYVKVRYKIVLGNVNGVLKQSQAVSPMAKLKMCTYRHG